ncbi:MAG: ABC transporter permease [Planctomycetes bacterium]|nr:ABC transporter permease [Planctomycetota bacterium]
MLGSQYAPLVLRQIWRSRTRSLLTMGGVAVAMFLYSSILGMQSGARAATEVTAGDATLIVYRENRYCPFTSQLPQFYLERIARLAGVESVVPVRIYVSNCRASLDVVTFRGVPPREFRAAFVPHFEIVAGSIDDWERRGDAALVGEALAARRGIEPGTQFAIGGITVHVAAIARSADPQDQNVAYTHLAFLQETMARGGTGGVVTQFNVRVTDPARLEEVARAIDAEFARERDPTSTRAEKEFVGRAAADVLEIVRFATWLGWGALAAVFALVFNAIVMAVQDRIRDHAIMQTLGYSGRLVAALIVLESSLLAFAGGLVGAGAAYAVIATQRYSMTMEGLNIEVLAGGRTMLLGLAMSMALGAAAGLAPGWRAARREIAASFRAV